MNQFLTEVQPAFMELLSAIVVAAISAACLKARQKWGIDIEDKYKRDLHDAAMTGARAVVAKLTEAGASVDSTSPAAVESVLDHMHKSTKDAISALEPDTGVLTKIAVAKLEVAKNEAVKETKP